MEIAVAHQQDSSLKARLILSVLFTIAITGCCLYLTWITASSYVRFPLRYTVSILERTDEAITAYRQKKGHLPRSLADLENVSNMWRVEGGVGDAWEHPLVYSVQGNRYKLVSYGRDGKPGGIGLDEDISSTALKRVSAKLPFLQVIFHPSAQEMVGMSLLSGLLAFVVSFKIIKPDDLNRNYRLDLVFKMGVTFFATLVLAALITILHVPSGH